MNPVFLASIIYFAGNEDVILIYWGWNIDIISRTVPRIETFLGMRIEIQGSWIYYFNNIHSKLTEKRPLFLASAFVNLFMMVYWTAGTPSAFSMPGSPASGPVSVL